MKGMFCYTSPEKKFKKILFVVAASVSLLQVAAQENESRNPGITKEEADQYTAIASQITIMRDTWGVPHIYANTDAQCAFGIMYAQCEDNFWQVEETFIQQLGRAAELYGESELGGDTEIALFECVKRAKQAYQNDDAIVLSSCEAAAAGINFYIYSDPSKARLIRYYEPWFFLLPSPASAGGHGITREERRRVLSIAPTSNRFGEGDDDWMEQQTS